MPPDEAAPIAVPAPGDGRVARAIAEQRRLAAELVLAPPPGFAPRLVAGVDLSFDRGGEVGYAGIVVIDTATMAIVGSASAVAPLDFPYVPGLLSFRELPPIEAAWNALAGPEPDAVIFDGQGVAHPRRFGIACHGGLRWGVPTVGCAKSLLVGTHAPLAPERGSRAPLVHRGETVGTAIRLRAGVAPVFVSPGHLMDLETAVEVVLAVSAGFREPETTRRAHRLVNERRRAAEAA